jgi:hypothetical protein
MLSCIFKRQVINLKNCCIWLADSVESMMMHGLANPKPRRHIWTRAEINAEWARNGMDSPYSQSFPTTDSHLPQQAISYFPRTPKRLITGEQLTASKQL